MPGKKRSYSRLSDRRWATKVLDMVVGAGHLRDLQTHEILIKIRPQYRDLLPIQITRFLRSEPFTWSNGNKGWYFAEQPRYVSSRFCPNCGSDPSKRLGILNCCGWALHNRFQNLWADLTMDSWADPTAPLFPYHILEDDQEEAVMLQLDEILEVFLEVTQRDLWGHDDQIVVDEARRRFEAWRAGLADSPCWGHLHPMTEACQICGRSPSTGAGLCFDCTYLR